MVTIQSLTTVKQIKRNQTRFKRFWAYFEDFWIVFREAKQPQHVSLHYHREYLILLWTYTNKNAWSSISFRIVHYIILINLAIMVISILCSLRESLNSIIDMGEYIVWIIGICLIKSKVWYIHFRSDEIDDVIKEYEYFNRRFWLHEQEEEILKLQRFFFIAEFFSHTQLTFLLMLFNLAICLQPLWTKQYLPFHAVFPFEWHNPTKHPVAHFIIYLVQCIMSLYNLNVIMEIDLLGIHAFTQTALNLKILCIELRKLGKSNENELTFRKNLHQVIEFHQHIISIVDKTNHVFYDTFILQMIASFLLVSLSTFETIAAKNTPKIAAKFVLLMMSTFIQLSLWCAAGEMVYSQSFEVANAAFDINDWHKKSPKCQREIMFVMQRAQRPLVYAARPFLPFTLSTYMAILKQCYAILALLSETID